MKPETISTLKKELMHLSPDQLVEYCIRLAKHKTENKELLSYLIYQSTDQALFIDEVKKEIDEQFKSLNKSQNFLAKKTVRKVLRTTLKYIKFSGEKTTELELLIYFCKKLRLTGLSLRFGSVLGNLYMRQHQRAKKAMSLLHEDLQMDYADEMDRIS
jgi:hypothetical protein